MRSSIRTALFVSIVLASTAWLAPATHAHPSDTDRQSFIDNVFALLQRMRQSNVNRFQMRCKNGCQTRGAIWIPSLGASETSNNISWDCHNRVCDIHHNGMVLQGVQQSCPNAHACISSTNDCEKSFTIAANDRAVEFRRFECNPEGFSLVILKADSKGSKPRAKTFRCTRIDADFPGHNQTVELTCNRI